MRIKLIAALSLMVGILTVTELHSQESDVQDDQPSVCENESVIMTELPKAVESKFSSVGTKVVTSDIEITNIAKSSTTSTPGMAHCYAGLRFTNHRGKTERYLIGYTVKQIEDKQDVVVTRINEL